MSKGQSTEKMGLYGAAGGVLLGVAGVISALNSKMPDTTEVCKMEDPMSTYVNKIEQCQHDVEAEKAIQGVREETIEGVRSFMVDNTPLLGRLSGVKIEARYQPYCAEIGSFQVPRTECKGAFLNPVITGSFEEKVVKSASDERVAAIGFSAFLSGLVIWAKGRSKRKKLEKNDLGALELLKSNTKRIDTDGYREIRDKSNLEVIKQFIMDLRVRDYEKFCRWVYALHLKAIGSKSYLSNVEAHWHKIFGNLNQNELLLLLYELNEAGIEVVTEDGERGVAIPSIKHLYVE